MDAMNNPQKKPSAENQKTDEARIGAGETLAGGRQIKAEDLDQVQGGDELRAQAGQDQQDQAIDIGIFDRLSKIDSCVTCVQISLLDLKAACNDIKDEIEAIRQQYASEL